MNDQYKNINIEDLIADQDFIDWVLENKRDQEWKIFLQNNPSLIEKFDEARDFILNFRDKTTEIDLHTKELIWSNIEKGTQSKTVFLKSKLNFIALAAASICILLIALPFFKDKIEGSKLEIITNNQKEEKREVILPDNSYVYLDKNASISYDKSEFKNSRKVKLKGQAFFEIEKGKSFIINTEKGSIEVLGTSFNILQKTDNLIVSCYTGKVKVRFGDKEIVLYPGEESNFFNKELKQDFIKAGSEPSWVSGQLVFDNIELSKVIKQIEEIYKIKVEIDKNLLSKRYTGIIVRNDINKALTSLFWPLHMKYALEGDKVKVTSDK